jgi:hypothetical protein
MTRMLSRCCNVSSLVQVRCGCPAAELFPEVPSWRKLANAALGERQRQRNPLWVAQAAGLDIFTKVCCCCSACVCDDMHPGHTLDGAWQCMCTYRHVGVEYTCYEPSFCMLMLLDCGCLP